jgi:hypothetical protein
MPRIPVQILFSMTAWEAISGTPSTERVEQVSLTRLTRGTFRRREPRTRPSRRLRRRTISPLLMKWSRRSHSQIMIKPRRIS